MVGHVTDVYKVLESILSTAKQQEQQNRNAIKNIGIKANERMREVCKNNEKIVIYVWCICFHVAWLLSLLHFGLQPDENQYGIRHTEWVRLLWENLFPEKNLDLTSKVWIMYSVLKALN